MGEEKIKVAVTQFTKEGVFPTEMSKMIGVAFFIRNASDYDDMFIASKDETAEQIANAEWVYKVISSYLDQLIGKMN